MAKWLVLKRLWSISQGKYIEPGEIVEISDAGALVLLAKECIKPATIEAAPKQKRGKDDPNN